MNSIKKIVDKGFCIGCGLCQDIGKDYGYSMVIDSTGFYIPKYKVSIAKIEKKINKVCPGINVQLKKSSGIWGNISTIYNGWAVDPVVRKKGSSGGVISALCIYLLESKTVHAILHVGRDPNHFMHNRLQISRSREAIIENASSRYAPALVLDKITEILNSTDEIFAFVGKPCDITAIKNYLQEYPQFSSRIKLFISIFCAGIPSYNATLNLLKQAKQSTNPISVKYRGDGWPGNFEALYQNEFVYTAKYNDSWGKVLGKQIHFRCKICPDGIGMFADIVAADSWETKDGYPDFEEKDGRSFIIARSQEASKIIQKSHEYGAIDLECLNSKTIKEMQPYQYIRRYVVGYRIIAVQLCTFFKLRFSGFGFYKRMFQFNPIKGLKVTYGTAKRYLKNK
jgi:coenzyme F420 hydrogenase subunit beta